MERVHIFFTLYIFSYLLNTVESIAGLSFGANVHCAVRKEISPCTCRHQEPGQDNPNTKVIAVICERMTSFQQVVTALQGRFDDDVGIFLKISHSVLDDLPQLNFQQMGLNIAQLRLIHNNLSALPESVFSGLSGAELVSFSDNILETIPQNVLQLMPKIKTLDISRANIANVTSMDLQSLQNLSTLILASNNISLLEMNAFPQAVEKLHIGGNRIKNLNGTLRILSDLEWVFINNNQIDTLEGELPEVRPNKRMKMLLAGYNKLVGLPEELKQFTMLDYLSLEGNKIKRLSGTIAHASRMKTINLFNNEIDLLENGEFAELSNLEELVLDHNRIRHINGSLLPLKSLIKLTISNNLMAEFNPNEIRGLTKLQIVDLSFNIICAISSKIIENQVDVELPRVQELKLDYNQLKNLSGSLGLSIKGLRRLNVSNNIIESIAPEDFLGFANLQILDISHNRLTTIGNAYETLIPSLEEIIASYNLISILEKELHGFPHLCWADFSYNKLVNISTIVADKTTCLVYGVNSTLRIYIQGNHAICGKKEINTSVMDVESRHNMKFLGFDECPRHGQSDLAVIRR